MLIMRRLRDGWWNLRAVRMAGQPVGLRHGVRWLPHGGLGHVLGRLRFGRPRRLFRP